MITLLSFLMVKDRSQPKISVRKVAKCSLNSPKLQLGLRLVLGIALAKTEYLIQ